MTKALTFVTTHGGKIGRAIFIAAGVTLAILAILDMTGVIGLSRPGPAGVPSLPAADTSPLQYV